MPRSDLSTSVDAPALDRVVGSAIGRTSGAPDVVRIRPRRERLVRFAVGTASIGVLLTGWQLAADQGFINSVYLPSPTTIARTGLELARSGDLTAHVTASAGRVAVGYSIAVVLGVVLAIVCHSSRIARYAISPPVEFVRGLAPLALLPAFMLLFGIGDESKIAILVWVGWVPIFLNLLEGMDRADPVLRKAARAMGASPRQVLTRITLPAAFPIAVVGLRLSMGATLMVLVAAEMLGSNSGIGFYILDASQTFRIPEMYVAIVLLGTLAFLVNVVFLVLARLASPGTRVPESVR